MVFKNDELVRVLSEGVYWLWPNEVVIMYDMAMPFPLSSVINLNVLLKNEDVLALTQLVEVRDNEIALHFENDFLMGVLSPGRYLFWKGLVNYRFETVNLSQVEIDVGIDKALLNRKELAAYVRSFTVETYELGVLFIDGKFNRMLEAGTYQFWKNSSTITVTKADLRNVQMEIAGQEILTRDKAAIRVSFFAQYQITDVVKAMVNNKDFDKQLYVLLQLALREFAGSFTLDELLDRKESIANEVMKAMTEKAEMLGVTLKGCGIRDIILPGDVKEIMNQVLVAEKRAQANTIMRREETASTRSLLNTAKLMEENAMLFKLKEMEYVEKIAERINTLSLSGGGHLVDQLKALFVPVK